MVYSELQLIILNALDVDDSNKTTYNIVYKDTDKNIANNFAI